MAGEATIQYWLFEQQLPRLKALRAARLRQRDAIPYPFEDEADEQRYEWHREAIDRLDAEIAEIEARR